MNNRVEESQAFESVRPYGYKITITDGMYNLRPAAGKTYRGALLSDPVCSTDREVDEAVMMLPMLSSNDTPDRRRRRRLRLAYPLRLYRSGEASRTETKTEDISCEGFFCVTNHPFSPFETLECELLIPVQEEGQPEYDIILRCQAQVVRVVQRVDDAAFGIACRLSDYTIRSEIIDRDLAMECA